MLQVELHGCGDNIAELAAIQVTGCVSITAFEKFYQITYTGITSMRARKTLDSALNQKCGVRLLHEGAHSQFQNIFKNIRGEVLQVNNLFFMTGAATQNFT